MKPLLGWSIFLMLNPAILADEKLTRYEYQEKHMGTMFRFVLYATQEEIAQKAAREGFNRVQKLNNIMSDYDPASELMQLCKKFDQEVGPAVKVSEDLFQILKKADEISRITEGSFDVTISPVVKLWRVSRRTQRLPDPKELKNALSRVGYRNVELEPKTTSIRLLRSGVQIDLGGIAKGFAADEVLKIFAKHGIHRALVAAGGDITVSDPPPEATGWKVEIAPLPGSKEKRILKLKNAGVSTSGDAENFVLIDGVRYSHIVDPKTGLGLTGYRSVTVIAKNGVTADSLTKAGSILPPDKALKIFESVEGVSALILRKIGDSEESAQSKKFAEYLWKD